MEKVRDLVVHAAGAATRAERIEAYGRLVEQCRDMACGYAYSILADFHLAEDAAQEAFIVAFERLGQLEQPEAFPGWFRRIVWSCCGRMTRRSTLPTVAMETAAEIPTEPNDPLADLERNEMRDEVLKAIRGLPAADREVTTLFYINGYSQAEVAGFLEVPITTVRNRLRASRGRLKERMMNMVEDTLHQNAPDERFSKAVIDDLLQRPRPLEIPGHPVREVALAIRQALPDFENVAGEEIVAKDAFLKMAEHSASLDRAFHVDDRRALRTETTITIMSAMIGRRPPVRLLVAGRVFRPDREDGTHSKVFHQLDVLWVDAGLSAEDMKQSIRVAVAAVLGHVELRWKELPSVDYDPYFEFAASWGGKWVNIGGCGMLRPETLREAGYTNASLCGVSYGLGLERLAAMKYGIDDVRKLWLPPYVR